MLKDSESPADIEKVPHMENYEVDFTIDQAIQKINET